MEIVRIPIPKERLDIKQASILKLRDNYYKRYNKSLSNNKIQTINPATQEAIDAYYIIIQQQINSTVRKARDSFVEWRRHRQKSRFPLCR